MADDDESPLSDFLSTDTDTSGSGSPDTSDTVTETTSQSWFGRLVDAAKGVVIGLVLMGVAGFVLFWNEGRAVETSRSLSEGAAVVVPADPARIDPGNEGHLVYLAGEARTGETLRDPEFAVTAPKVLVLHRRVEMYQWEEKEDSKTEKKLGGGSDTTKTYSYRMTWSERPIDSSYFRKSGHANPAMPFASAAQMTKTATIGPYTVPPALLQRLSALEPLAVTEEARAQLAEPLLSRAKIAGPQLYVGGDPASPQVGDVRVTFTVLGPGPVSLIAKQVGSTFEPYRAQAGGTVQIVKSGIHSSESMFKAAQRENMVMTWALRAVGLIVMFFGAFFVLRPLAVVADVVPLLGSFVEVGVAFAAGIVAVVLSVVVAGAAWVVYRPLVGVGLLVVAAIVVAAGVWFVRRKQGVDAPVRVIPATAAAAAVARRQESQKTVSTRGTGPSRWYYAAAVVVFLVGVGSGAAIVINEILRVTAPPLQMSMPGAWEIVLQQPGRHTIFYEHRSVIGNKVYTTPATMPGMQFALLTNDTHQPLALARPNGELTYQIGPRAGSAYMQFNVDRPGVYVISAQYPSNPGPEIAIAIGAGDPGEALLRTAGTALPIVGGSVLLSLAISAVTFVRRRRAKRAA